MDTVVLLLHLNQYWVLNPNLFDIPYTPINPDNTEERIKFLQDYHGHRRYKLNASPKYRENGIIYPNITIDEKVSGNLYTRDLKISFSCPKLIWCHSFDEVLDLYFQKVIDTLRNRLYDFKIIVEENILKNAIVHTLNYCANIPFKSEEETRIFLDRLSKCSLEAWFENNDRTYSSDGHAFRFHTNIFEIVFYLKYYDVLVSRKSQKADKRTTPQEKDVVLKYLKEGKIPPVVRIEIRMNGTRSVRSHLKASTGIDKDYWTFQEAFNQLLNRKVLKYYWNNIINDPLNHAILITTSDYDICRKLIEYNKDDKLIKSIAEPAGLFYLLKSLGEKNLYELVKVKQCRQAWYRKKSIIIKFLDRYVKGNESLIDTVTNYLENKPKQTSLLI